MKILYCLPQVHRPGGIERVISLKANYFADKCGWEVYIVTSNQKGNLPFYHFSERVNFINLDIDYESTLTLPLWKRTWRKSRLTRVHKQKLSKILNEVKPDIVISTFTHEASFLPSIKDGSKKILEFHFCKGHKRKMADAFGFPLLTKLAYYAKCWQEENVIIPKYDQFVVLTEEDKRDWEKKVPSVKCIPNILPFESNEQAVLESKSVIAVGRLDAQKGFDILISLWSKIHNECPDWHLDIFGQGKDEKKLKDMILQYNLEQSVCINKPSKNIKEKYLKSSLLLMTSRYEGWGMVLTEAMQCGLPVVAFGCKCGPKDIITDGEDGFCIPCWDTEMFINEVVEIMKDQALLKKMGNNAYRNVQRFSEENIMPLWIDLFNKIISSK